MKRRPKITRKNNEVSQFLKVHALKTPGMIKLKFGM